MEGTGITDLTGSREQEIPTDKSAKNANENAGMSPKAAAARADLRIAAAIRAELGLPLRMGNQPIWQMNLPRRNPRHRLRPPTLPSSQCRSRPLTCVPFHQYQDPCLMSSVVGPGGRPPHRVRSEKRSPKCTDLATAKCDFDDSFATNILVGRRLVVVGGAQRLGSLKLGLCSFSKRVTLRPRLPG